MLYAIDELPGMIVNMESTINTAIGKRIYNRLSFPSVGCFLLMVGKYQGMGRQGVRGEGDGETRGQGSIFDL